MAEGLARQLLPNGVAIYSAGSHPSHVHPRAIEAMHEVGIDISAQRSKGFEQVPLEGVDYVITLCAEAAEACPVFVGDVQRLHWPLPDPAAAQGSPEEVMVTFRAVRDARPLGRRHDAGSLDRDVELPLSLRDPDRTDRVTSDIHGRSCHVQNTLDSDD